MGLNFAQKKKLREIEFFNAGMQTGRQMMWDAVQACMKNKDVVGKDTFGEKRLKKLFDGVYDWINDHWDAWTTKPEADVEREHIDAELKQGISGEFIDFEGRYPNIKKITYK